jgi:hypothetical protein
MFHYKSCPRYEISPLALERVTLLSDIKHLPFVAYKLLLVLLFRLSEIQFISQILVFIYAFGIWFKI